MLVVEHRWGSEGWAQTRPVYYSVDEAVHVARRVAELGAQRAGYEVRIRRWTGEVLIWPEDGDCAGHPAERLSA